MAARREQETVVSFPSREPRLRNQLQRGKLIPGFSREYLQEALSEELRNSATASRPLSVVLLELDELPHLIKTYGRQRGEKVIDGVTRILEGNIRKNDFVACCEAGKFALILRDTDFAAAARVCERIRSSVEEAVFAPRYGTVLRTTVSSGYATYPAGAPFRRPQDFLQVAEDRLLEAKQLGQNRVVGSQFEEAVANPAAVKKNASE
jgi:diguanylate cyclase (GGDEF)-like protein